MAENLIKDLPPLQKKNEVHFRPDHDYIDPTAKSTLPNDGPQDMHAVWTQGDGNCMCRSLIISHCGNDSMHIEF